MASLKFSEHDRRKVISEVEKYYGVELSTVDRWKRYLHDETGLSYWVLGGYGDWHGISQQMMREERPKKNGLLVIAQIYADKMRENCLMHIFSGDLRPLIENAASLSRTEEGDYQFDIHVRGDHLLIKQVSGYFLKKIGMVSCTVVDELVDRFDSYSPEEQQEFIELLKKKLNK